MNKKIGTIISRAMGPILPSSLEHMPTYSTNGLFFAMFNLGISQELQLDPYWFWLLDDLAEISDAIIDAGVLP